jgi:hypothetical protein
MRSSTAFSSGSRATTSAGWYRARIVSATCSAVSPKRKKFSAPTASRSSMLAPSSVPTVSAPLSANFMFPVPDASLPAVEICSETSAAG